MSRVCLCDMCGTKLADIIFLSDDYCSQISYEIKVFPLPFGLSREYNFCKPCLDKIEDYIKENKHD